MAVDVLVTEKRAESTEPNSCLCGDTEPCCKGNTNKPERYTLEKGRLCLYFTVYCKNQPQYLRGSINSMIRGNSIPALQCSYQLFSFIYLEQKKKLKQFEIGMLTTKGTNSRECSNAGNILYFFYPSTAALM